jgi:hypothetical protein
MIAATTIIHLTTLDPIALSSSEAPNPHRYGQ